MTQEEINAKLDELRTKLGDTAKEQIALYGPVLVQMAKADLDRWLRYVFAGNYAAAYELYLAASGDDAYLAEVEKEHLAWKSDLQANADRIAMANEIGLGFARAMLTVVLGLFTF